MEGAESGPDAGKTPGARAGSFIAPYRQSEQAMRAERSWYFGVLVGAFVTLAFYAGELKRGTPEQVRDAWLEASHVFVALVALLGLGFASWRPRTRLAGKVVAGAGMGALATHFLLVLTVPLAPAEAPVTLAWAALDLLGWAAIPGLLLVATHPTHSSRVSRAAIHLAVLVAALLAARLLWSASVAPTPLRAGIAVAWSSFVFAAGWRVARWLLRTTGARPELEASQPAIRQAIPR